MFVITHRSIAFSIATLLIVSSTASAQGGQSTSDPSTSQPAIQSGVMTSGLYSLKEYWYPVAPYGADVDDG